MKAKEAPETYPVQFRDKIDEYLCKEHHILAGCCSSIEEMKYSVAREVAKKLTDAFVEKACEWIKENLLKHIYVYEGEVGIGMAVFLEEFKQAMKGE